MQSCLQNSDWRRIFVEWLNNSKSRFVPLTQKCTACENSGLENSTAVILLASSLNDDTYTSLLGELFFEDNMRSPYGDTLLLEFVWLVKKRAYCVIIIMASNTSWQLFVIVNSSNLHRRFEIDCIVGTTAFGVVEFTPTRISRCSSMGALVRHYRN